ncbi:MAG: copper chaperone PCu(A)C [Chloroflexales bacterium]|nr:copper chaperone PCu(A)C [Chloroflexales bacterium]
MRRIFTFGLAAIASLALAGCGGTPASTTQPAATQQTAAPAAPAATLGALTINDPWVRPATPMARVATPMPEATPMAGATEESMGGMDMGATTNTGGYLTITNSGSEPDFLVSASVSPELVEAVELHTMIDEGGVMKMRPVEKIEVPANGEAVLKPGGFHVMFIGVKKELKDGDVVKLSLTFEKAGTVEVDAVVRTPMQ